MASAATHENDARTVDSIQVENIILEYTYVSALASTPREEGNQVPPYIGQAKIRQVKTRVGKFRQDEAGHDKIGQGKFTARSDKIR